MIQSKTATMYTFIELQDNSMSTGLFCNVIEVRFKTCSFSRSVIHPSHQISNTLSPWFDVGRSTALYKILDSSESKFVFMLYILFDRIYCIGEDSATARAHSPKQNIGMLKKDKIEYWYNYSIIKIYCNLSTCANWWTISLWYDCMNATVLHINKYRNRFDR